MNIQAAGHRARPYHPPATYSSSVLSVFRICVRPNIAPPPIRCSTSQLHDYAAVDHERPPAYTWHALYRRISMMGGREQGVAAVLAEWEAEGRALNKWELSRIAKELRKFRRYKYALQVYEWIIDRADRFKIITSDVAIQLDLIYKVRGISSAEDFFSKLPSSLKDMRTYGALLNAYARANMREKAEATFKMMKTIGFTLQTLSYNVMMTLYMNLEEYDLALLLISEMEERNVYLDAYSFNIWITICGRMGNVEEMEKVMERMKLNARINPNWSTYSTLASMYIKLGFIDKAEECLKDLELRITGRDRTPFHYLLSLYSSLGRKEDVYRVWNYYKSSFPKIPNLGYHAVISACARVGDIEGAKAIFEEWAFKKTATLDPRISNIIIGWYVKEGMVDEAEAFFYKIREGGCMPNTNTWEVLAEGNIRRKNVAKALFFMKEAASMKRPQWRPKPANISAFLDLCDSQGDSTSAASFRDILREINDYASKVKNKSMARENYEPEAFVSGELKRQVIVSGEYSDSEVEEDIFADPLLQ